MVSKCLPSILNIVVEKVRTMNDLDHLVYCLTRAINNMSSPEATSLFDSKFAGLNIIKALTIK